MSEIENVLNTRNQSITNFDVSKFLLGDNEFGKGTHTDSGSGSTLATFLLLGKVAVGGAIVELAPGASDGSQFPIGLLWLGGSASITLAAAEAFTAEYVNKGNIAKSKIAFPSGVALSDIITGDGRTVEDYLNAMGFVLLEGVELTGLDNQ